MRIGFLTQELPEKTVLTSKEIVTKGLGEIGHLLIEYERLSVCHSHEKAINEQRLNSVQKEIDNEKFLDWALSFDKNDHQKYVKDNMKPFEILFFDVGAEILKISVVI